MAVRIFKLANHVDWWTWLCDAHLAEWIANGWQIREQKDPPHPVHCDDCNGGVAAVNETEPNPGRPT